MSVKDTYYPDFGGRDKYRPGEQEAIAAWLADPVNRAKVEQRKAERLAQSLAAEATPTARDDVDALFRAGKAEQKAKGKERSNAWKEGVPSYLKVATKASVAARRVKADQRAKAMLAEFRSLGGDVPDRLKRGAVMRILADRENITTTAIRDVLRRGYRLEGRKE